MQLEKNQTNEKPKPAGINRPPWWAVYGMAAVTGFGLCIKTIVSEGRTDLKEQLKEANARQDKLIITLQQNNIMTANLLNLVRELKNTPGNEKNNFHNFNDSLTGNGRDNFDPVPGKGLRR